MALKKNFKNFIKFRFDYRLFGAILILSIFGLINLAGIFGINNIFFKKQLFFFFIGLIVLIFSSLIDYRIFKNHSLPSALFLILSIFLLLLTLKARPIRGVSAWLTLPLGFSFGTSEVVKLALILFLAKFFSSKFGLNKIRVILTSLLYSFFPIFLIFSQPDFGSAFILFLIWFGGVFFFGIPKEHLAAIFMALIIIFLIVSIFGLKSYQKSRLISFFNAFLDLGKSEYNVSQAKIAIGSGGLWGRAFGRGTQAKYGLLPEVSSDFAFAAFLEQFGFFGLIIVLILYFTILNRLIFIASKTNDNFSKFFIFLFSIYFFSHVLINIGMNFGLLPVVGLPLPFISYGGSFFISLMFGFGIVESIRFRSL